VAARTIGGYADRPWIEQSFRTRTEQLGAPARRLLTLAADVAADDEALDGVDHPALVAQALQGGVEVFGADAGLELDPISE